MPLSTSSVQFGTDGWRGVLGMDFTMERLLPVAAAAAQELAFRAPKDLNSRTVIIGYDRRFLASKFAEAIAAERPALIDVDMIDTAKLPRPFVGKAAWAIPHEDLLP